MRHTDIKERLAYSTVSQVSYVVLGLKSHDGGGHHRGVVHLVHQGMMKIALFFCAGLFKETVDVANVKDTRGLGYRMPWASTAFTVGALGMIGIPPTAGLSPNGIWASVHWTQKIPGYWASYFSSLLNSMYFLPIIYRMWFFQPDHAEPKAVTEPKTMLLPALVTTGFVLAMGLGASIPFAPLGNRPRNQRRVFANVD